MPPRAKRKTAAELEAEAKAAMVARIRESFADWEAGKWAEEVNYGPACHCGVRGAKEPCTRHGQAQEMEADEDAVAAGG